MNLGQLGHPLLHRTREGGECIFLRPVEMNLLHVSKQCLPVSADVRLPWLIVQRNISYRYEAPGFFLTC